MFGDDAFEDLMDRLTGRRPARPATRPAANVPPPPPRKPEVNWRELIRRGVSHVRVGGKVYRVEVTEYVKREG